MTSCASCKRTIAAKADAACRCRHCWRRGGARRKNAAALLWSLRRGRARLKTFGWFNND